MAFAGSRVLPRDTEAGSSSNLTAGAIAGIACGAGALFLGAAGLFLIYWRRQRQFDREDSYYQDRFDDPRRSGAMAPVLTYAMDYKLDDPQHHEGDQASAYTYSPEKPSYPYSALSPGDGPGAMPAHPAYIPRALLRGAATPSNRSVMDSTTSPPPFPSPASSSNPKNQPDDALIQAYLNAAVTTRTADPAGGQPLPPPQSPPVAGNQLHGPVTPPLHSAGSSSSTDHTYTSLQQQGPGGRPRVGLPLRLSLPDKPLPGRENMSISGPLAFPQHYQPPAAVRSHWAREDGHDGGDGGGHYYYGTEGGPGEGTRRESTSTKRSFRSRAFAGGFGSGSSGSGGGAGGGGHQEGKDKAKKHGRKRSDGNASGGGGNRHYAEIEIGRDSDIW